MSNKEVMSLEGVVKNDSSVEQRVYFVRGLERRSRASIKRRLFEDSISLKGGYIVYFVRGSPTLTNLEDDHEFISKEYISN